MPIKFWTIEKIDFIRNNVHIGDRELAAYFKVSKAAVKIIRLKHSILIRPNNQYTPAEDQILIELYPDIRTDKLAKQLNRTKLSVYQRAFSFGLKKSPEFLASPESGILTKGHTRGKATQFKKGQTPVNKGVKMSPEVRERVQHTFFKKGHLPHNTKSDFEISIRHTHSTRSNPIPYQFIRLSKANWIPLHRYLWKENNGPIPEGFNVTFKDGNSLNCSLKNLELISNEELARRNQLANWPEDLREVIKLNNRLKTILNDRH